MDEYNDMPVHPGLGYDTGMGKQPIVDNSALGFAREGGLGYGISKGVKQRSPSMANMMSDSVMQELAMIGQQATGNNQQQGMMQEEGSTAASGVRNV